MINTNAVDDEFIGNGVTTVFPTNVYGTMEGQFKIYIGDESLNGELQTLTTDYTLSNLSAADESGVIVTMLVAPADEAVIRVYRDTAPMQTLNVTEARAYDPRGVETILDLLTMSLQEIIIRSQNSIQVRSPTLPFTPTEGSTIIWEGDTFVPGPTVAEISTVAANAAAAAASAIAAAASAAEALARELSMVRGTGQWLTATAYTPSDLAYEDGTQYECIVAHTSGVFATDLGTGKWRVFVLKGAAGAGTGDVLGANNGSDFVDKPATLANLGGQPSDSDLTALAGLGVSDLGFLDRTAVGAILTRSFSSQAEAEAGVNEISVMNPLRTAQAIEATENAWTVVADFNRVITPGNTTLAYTFADDKDYRMLGRGVSRSDAAGIAVTLTFENSFTGATDAEVLTIPLGVAASTYAIELDLPDPRSFSLLKSIRSASRVYTAGALVSGGLSTASYALGGGPNATATDRLNSISVDLPIAVDAGQIALYERKRS